MGEMIARKREIAQKEKPPVGIVRVGVSFGPYPPANRGQQNRIGSESHILYAIFM